MSLWKEKIIKPNKYSRPQKKITAVRKIVMHWTANLGATANGHYNYFNTLSGRYASAHFFIDKTESILIIPLNEIAYHANDGSKRKIAELRPNANFLSIGIELCVEKDGSFHPNTIKQAEAVAAELCKRYKLDPKTDIVRHYDITGKNCPAPWVKSSTGLVQFRNNVAAIKSGVPTSSATAPKPTAPSTDALPDNPVLRRGASGVAVERLQESLNILGYKLAVDGDFGAGTENAVKSYQKKRYLIADGVVGEKTWSSISHDKKILSEPKPVVTPTPAKPSGGIGVALIKEGELNVRNAPNLTTSKVLRQVKQGDEFTVYEVNTDFLRIGENEWILNGGGGYATYTPNAKSEKPVTGVVEIVKDIPVRDNASTNAKATGKILKKGGKYKVYSLVNDMYNVGGNEWIYSKGGYTSFKPD